MATKHLTKLRIPSGRVLRFTPTGKSVRLSDQDMADEKTILTMPQRMFAGATPQMREIFLKLRRGESLKGYL